MVLKKYIFIAFLLSIKIIANCQTQPELKLVTRAEDYKIQERVILSLDQDLYLAGEQVNIFALTFDAALQIPINFSSVLYVELYNQENNVICTKKIQLKQGECVNNLILPRKIETGYYYIRAYTNYMKNFGPEFFYTKRIKIINPFYRIKYQVNADVAQEKMKLDVTAEGGKIVYDIENKIVFHIPNFNDSIHVLLYENDSVLTKANTKNGFGVFNFTPKTNKRYRIEASSNKKGKTVVELKDFVLSGVICKLDSVKESNAYFKFIAKNYDKFPITVFVENNTILYKYSNTIIKPDVSMRIGLPAGLNKIILKNINQEVVFERLIYIKPNSKLEITAKLNKKIAFPGDSVILQINSNVKDSIHYVVALNLGNQNTSPALQGLMESMLYTSSIATYTSDVYYNDLQNISSNSEDINDYILRFKNNGATNSGLKNINYLPEILNDIVSGSVRKKSDQSLANNKIIYLSFIDSISWINRCKTDNSGRFVAALPIDYQGDNLIITVKDTTENYLLKFDDEFYPDFLKIVKENYYPDSSLKDIIESRMINLQVKDAYSELQEIIKPSRPDLRFYGYPDSEYKFSKYLVPNLEEFISEITRKAIVIKNGKRLEIKLFKKAEKNILIGDHPLIIFDGIPLLKNDNLTSIPSNKLESIRMVASKFFFGTEVFDGIVDITSKTKNFDLVEKDKNSTRVLFSPVKNGIDNYQMQNSRIPNYESDVYFKELNSVSGNESILLKLPQNTGNYSISVFGYTKDGESRSISIPNILTIAH